MVKLSDQLNIRIDGHLKIVGFKRREDMEFPDRGRVLVNKHNAIHPEHARIIIARGLADNPDGRIYSMWFGRGGATVDPLGNIVYATPNISGASDLNTPLFFVVVDQNKGASPGNSMSIIHVNGTLFTDVIVFCTVDLNQPFGQPAFSNEGPVNLNTSPFNISEIALKTQDNLLMTMVTFNPITKSADRILSISYDLRISLAQ